MKSRFLYFLACVFIYFVPLIFILLLSTQNVYSLDATLVWNFNSEENLAGYRIFYRENGQSYDYKEPAWEGSETTCTIYNLDNNTTYYFVARAFDTEGSESGDSNETCYQPSHDTLDYSLISQSQLTIVSVDSEELVAEDGAAENAIDGVTSTFWLTEWYQSEPTCPHEIVIHLDNRYLVGGFQYLTRQDGNINGTVADYSIYVSEDGITWGEAVATGTFAGDTTKKEVTFAGKSGRYVRFVAMSEVNGNPWTSAAEINILGIILPADSDDGIIDNDGMDQDYSLISQSQLTIVSVDSEELVAEDGAAENAIDGVTSTFWLTEWYQSEPTCPHEIVIHLDNRYLVGGFQYLTRQDGNINGTVADYSIYVSEDGITWGEAVATGTFAGDTTKKEVTFAGKSGRYVRFVAMSEVNGNPWTSAAEINILGSILID